MTHAEMTELYELYALGALDFEEAVEIDRHVADNCEHCLAQIEQAIAATAMMSGMQDSTEPPAHVRKRLLASVSPQVETRSRRFNWWLPAFATACAALLIVGVWSALSLHKADERYARVNTERKQLREALQVLSASQPTLVRFGKSAAEPQGTVFFNRNGGFVMTGSHLPEIASDKTFELWVIPKSGAPIPAGLFREHNADAHSFVHTYQEPINVAQVAAVAVTVEPAGGSMAPSTKPFLVVPIG